MHYSKCNLGYIIKVEEGEELHAALLYFAKAVNLKSAFYEGIGAVKQVHLGYWRSELNDYEIRIFNGQYELGSIIGNLSWSDQGPLLHSHAVFGDQNYQAFAGHFVQAFASPHAEILVFPVDIALTRAEVPGFRYKALVSTNWIHVTDLPDQFS